MLVQSWVTLCDAGPFIDALLDKYLAQKKRNNFKMLLFHVIYSKHFDGFK